MTNDMIMDVVKNPEKLTSDDENDVYQNKMMNFQGLSSTEKTIECIEKKDVTPAILMTLLQRRNIVAEQRLSSN